MQKNEDIFPIWTKFSHQLIETKELSENTVRLYTSLESAYFFNTKSLAAKLVDNRLLVAVPSFLTAIGILGTFIGLTVSLSGVNFNSDIDRMKDGVMVIINGANTAFITSLVGILLSLLFNFFEKFCENNTRKDIAKLQNKLNALFPLFNVDRKLKEIAESNQEAQKCLQGLAEQIGTQMQTALTDSLQQILIPQMQDIAQLTRSELSPIAKNLNGLPQELKSAIKESISSIGESIGEGNSEALEVALGKFTDNLKQAGSNHGQTIAESNIVLQDTITQMRDVMGSFIGNLENKVKEQSLHHNSINEKTQEVVNNLNNIIKPLESLLTQGEGLQSSVSTTHQHISDLSQQLQNASKNLDNSANYLNQFGHNVQTASETLSTTLIDATNSTKNLADTNQQTANMLNQYLSEFNELGEGFTQTMTTMVDQSGTSLSKLGHHQQDFLDKVHQLLEPLADLIKQGKSLQEEIQSTNSKQNEVVGAMSQITSQFNNASNNINALGSNLRETSSNLSNSLTETVNNTKRLSEINKESAVQLSEKLKDFTLSSQEITNNMQLLLTNLDTTLSNLGNRQDNFLNGIKERVQTLNDEMQLRVQEMNKLLEESLKNYAEQANGNTADIFKEWSSGTTTYANNMNRAIDALSSVVDEIQVKTGRS